MLTSMSGYGNPHILSVTATFLGHWKATVFLKMVTCVHLFMHKHMERVGGRKTGHILIIPEDFLASSSGLQQI